ncbi:hypothetical protein LL06_20820 [Hoeflea sp. BAL378]|nr:hypothetical protein LL06_20820 [Hoeflea sp. BAL378]
MPNISSKPDTILRCFARPDYRDGALRQYIRVSLNKEPLWGIIEITKLVWKLFVALKDYRHI